MGGAVPRLRTDPRLAAHGAGGEQHGACRVPVRRVVRAPAAADPEPATAGGARARAGHGTAQRPAVHRGRPGPAERRRRGPGRPSRAGHRAADLGKQRRSSRSGPYPGQPPVQRHRLGRQPAAGARRPLADGAAHEPRGRAVDPVPLPARRHDGAHRPLRLLSPRRPRRGRRAGAAATGDPAVRGAGATPAADRAAGGPVRRPADRAGRRSGDCAGPARARAGGRHPGADHLRLHGDGFADRHRRPRRHHSARRQRPGAAAPARAHP